VVAIEPQVFDLLVHLIRQREHVVSRDEMIASIWGGRIVSESALSTRINAVRSVIGDSGTDQRLIKTLPSKGVRFVGEVREERKASEAAPATSLESRAVETIEVPQANERLPARQTIEGHAEALALVKPTPFEPRRFFIPRATIGVFAAISVLCLSVLTWSYFARSERTRTDIETAAKLTGISEKIPMTSREGYEAVRALRQWAVDLDRHNAAALANLSFAIVGGVLNHWSDDPIADLRASRCRMPSLLHRGACACAAHNVKSCVRCNSSKLPLKHAANLLRASPSTCFPTRKSDMTS